jgi:hypothetical protein
MEGQQKRRKLLVKSLSNHRKTVRVVTGAFKAARAILHCTSQMAMTLS